MRDNFLADHEDPAHASLMENAALVAMETMFNGIPVLASNRGGLPETIGDAGSDPRAALSRGAATPENRRRRGASGAQRVTGKKRI